MEKNKENAWNDYIKTVLNSWTYNRMSTEEQEKCLDALREARLKGGYRQRWEHLQDMYGAFLYGLGYTGHLWRETDPEAPLF